MHAYHRGQCRPTLALEEGTVISKLHNRRSSKVQSLAHTKQSVEGLAHELPSHRDWTLRNLATRTPGSNLSLRV